MRIHAPILGIALAIWLYATGAGADTSLVCVNDYDRSTRFDMVETGLFGSKILRWHGEQGFSEYRLEQETSSHYHFVKVDPKTSDSATRIRIDRVTGEMTIMFYTPKRSLPVLVRFCNHEIDYKTCEDEVGRLPGGNINACSLLPDNHCQGYKKGKHLSGISRKQCRVQEPLF
jgi:hypothetical protein